MLYIYFNGTKAQQSKYCYGVQQNNKTNVVRFIIEKQQGDIDLSWLSCTLKLQNAANDYLDLIDLSPNVIDNGVFLEITWLIESKSTQYKNLELQLQFMNEEEVWQTEICELELSNTIPVGDTVSSAESSLIQALISRINECEQKVEVLENKKYALTDKENTFEELNVFNNGFSASSPDSESSFGINDDGVWFNCNIECWKRASFTELTSRSLIVRNNEKSFETDNENGTITTNYLMHLQNGLLVDNIGDSLSDEGNTRVNNIYMYSRGGSIYWGDRIRTYHDSAEWRFSVKPGNTWKDIITIPDTSGYISINLTRLTIDNSANASAEIYFKNHYAERALRLSGQNFYVDVAFQSAGLLPINTHISNIGSMNLKWGDIYFDGRLVDGTNWIYLNELCSSLNKTSTGSTIIKWTEMLSFSLSADTTFTFETAKTDCLNEYKGIITNSCASSIVLTFTGISHIICNDDNCVISSNTLTLPAGTTIEISALNNNLCAVNFEA